MVAKLSTSLNLQSIIKRRMRYNNDNTTRNTDVGLKKEDHHINKKMKDIEKGLDFILSHLEELTIFPRTIMTKKLGYQRKVYSKERVLEHFTLKKV